MQVQSTRFGVLEIEDSTVIKMTKGMFGFEGYEKFCLVRHREDTSFRWLQSLDDASLAFVVIDPMDFFASYDIEIPDADAEKLELSNPEDVMVLSLVTIGGSPEELTVNLIAPIVVNTSNLLGMQVVLQDTRFQTKHRLVETQTVVMANTCHIDERVVLNAA